MLGEILKNKREEAGLDLREVAHTLRFQYEYLKALEDEDLKRLPPDVYVKAYIKGYANFLKIDPLPLLDDYAELGRKDSAAALPEPPSPKKNSLTPKVVLFSSLIAAAVVLGIVFFLYPKRPEAPAPSPVAVPQAVPQAAVPQVSVPQETAPPELPQQHVLDVTATETTWLQVETAEGISEEVLLRQGETRKWTSETGFDLKVGNAGGIRLMLDNKDVGPPGEKGRVVRLHLP